MNSLRSELRVKIWVGDRLVRDAKCPVMGSSMRKIRFIIIKIG